MCVIVRSSQCCDLRNSSAGCIYNVSTSLHVQFRIIILIITKTLFLRASPPLAAIHGASAGAAVSARWEPRAARVFLLALVHRLLRVPLLSAIAISCNQGGRGGGAGCFDCRCRLTGKGRRSPSRSVLEIRNSPAIEMLVGGGEGGQEKGDEVTTAHAPYPPPF